MTLKKTETDKNAKLKFKRMSVNRISKKFLVEIIGQQNYFDLVAKTFDRNNSSSTRVVTIILMVTSHPHNFTLFI